MASEAITKNDLKAILEDVLIAKLPVDDYVVEHGTDGIWTYRKWNSGIAECWGSVVKNLTVSAAWGSWYNSETFVENFPTGLFIEPPIVIPQQDNSAYQTGGVGKSPHDGVTATDTGKWYVFRPTTAVTTDYRIVFYVKGRWK